MKDIDDYYDVGIKQIGHLFYGMIDDVIVTGKPTTNAHHAMLDAIRRFERGTVLKHVHAVTLHYLKCFYTPIHIYPLHKRIHDIRPYYMLLKKIFMDFDICIDESTECQIYKLISMCELIFSSYDLYITKMLTPSQREVEYEEVV